MQSSSSISKIGAYSLPAQCLLLLAALLLGGALNIQNAFAWLLFASLLVGLVAFCAGIALSVLSRRLRWLGLSAASLFVAFFTLLIGLAVGGHPGV
jgi:uncharacterized membrane protein YhaH (DUF805 family)